MIVLRLPFRRSRDAGPSSPVSDGFDDWSDLKLGPNRATTGPQDRGPVRVAFSEQLRIEQRVAHEFNAYAMFAFPREIGGLLRVVPDGNGGNVAVELRVFPHIAASGGYFELDGAAVAAFNMQLFKEGRAREAKQWSSLIHSHPGFAPFLSGTDRENVVRLAGPGRAWSVICSARRQPEGNYYNLHYAQNSPLPFVVTDGTLTAAGGGSLAGLGTLSESDIERIRAHVSEALSGTRR